MGKRTQQTFTKRPRDYYGTIDPDAVTPLTPFIKGKSIAEVCAGKGDLAGWLKPFCKVSWWSDIDPQNGYIVKKDAIDIRKVDMDYYEVDCIVTNPPFSWNLLKPLLDHLPTLRPTWLLLPADVAHNKRMAPHMRKCQSVVSVGRLYWMENKIKGVENYAWFCFDETYSGDTIFYGRT